MTAFYSMRLLYSAFYSEPQGTRVVLTASHEPSLAMSIPLVVLMLASIYIGYIMKDLMIGVGSPYIDFVGKESHHSMETEFMPTLQK